MSDIFRERFRERLREIEREAVVRPTEIYDN